jgi:beta-aspartyl-peptidase (threonine type)
VAALIRHKHLTLEDACNEALRQRIAPLRGDAGLIAVDPEGNVSMPFTTTIMHRGWMKNGTEPHSACTR